MEPDALDLHPSWGLLALRGVLAILFGVLALVQPLAALAALVILFGVWAFVDGVSAFALFFGGWRAWQLILVGLIGIGVGVLTFFRPGITAVGLYAAAATWAIIRGILEITLAIRLRRRVTGESWMIFGGIASIIFGVLMIALPLAGMLALAWLIGFYALLFGAAMIGLSMRLYRYEHRPPIVTPTPRAV